VLLAPADLAIELAIADMHDAELDQRAPVRCGKEEADGVRIEDFQARPRLEVQIVPGLVRLA
jgi:hypothetical protein